MSDVQTSPWYPQTIPPEFGSDRGSVSTQNAADLNNRDFDYVVVGSGVGGSYAAYRLAGIAAQRKTLVRILVIDRGKAFGGLSGISGGEISAGLGIGSEWVNAAWGRDTAEDFLRHTMLSTRRLMQLCNVFETATGHAVRTSTGLLTAITDNDLEEHSAHREADTYDALVAHDEKYRTKRGPQQPISVASLAPSFRGARIIPPEDMIGGTRYKRGGILIPGEGAVNPAMLGVMMRYTANGELFGGWPPNVEMCFQEYLDVENISSSTGILDCKDMKTGDPVQIRAKKIVLAGVSAKIVRGFDLSGKDSHLATKDYRTIIAVTEPLEDRFSSSFTSAVHDTTRNYNYYWQDTASRRLMWGTGDYNVHPGMPTDEMQAHVDREMGETLGFVPKSDWLWPGDIPYTRDGLPAVFKKGRVAGWIAPGGNGLSASAALASIVCGAHMGSKRETALLKAMMKREDGFNPALVASETPGFLKPAPFKIAEETSPVLETV